MTFNSVSFFAFFPLAVLVCWLVPRRWQNAALLAVSYAFYCFNTPAWLPVLVLDSLATWRWCAAWTPPRVSPANGGSGPRWA
ncbi:MAG: hypothetical protein ACLVJ8_04555 [Ruthenibacterium lactatiformans]